MTLKLNRLFCTWAAALAAVAVVSLCGCATGKPVTPKRSGFLYNYENLKEVDPTTWRYVNTNRLSLYSKFIISPVKILVNQFDGKPVTAEEKTKAAAFVRESLTKALEAKGYSVVTNGYADVAEVRVAITDAYKSGNQVGLTVEGSIIDRASAYQAAAVMKTELAEAQLGSWWDNARAKEIVDRWSERMAEAVAAAHGK